MPGTIALIGPTLLGKDLDQQVEIADVTNGSEDTAASWRVELDLPVGEADDVVIAVPASKTIRVQIPITVVRSGTVTATATLHDADGLVSSSALDVTSVDLSDCTR